MLRGIAPRLALFAALASLTLGAALVFERVLWRWVQDAKLGEPMQGPSISAVSFWLSMPWAALTFVLIACAWMPSARWIKPALFALLALEAGLIWWMGVAHGLR